MSKAGESLLQRDCGEFDSLTFQSSYVMKPFIRRQQFLKKLKGFQGSTTVRLADRRIQEMLDMWVAMDIDPDDLHDFFDIDKDLGKQLQDTTAIFGVWKKFTKDTDTK